ncbi:MAG: DMT family transporter [Oscillospiraceae bacterium]|jgi:drug/metabolite transporter (DMT)-like permease|nr:DMT family transporter [Oscillospiraceae bacterium]
MNSERPVSKAAAYAKISFVCIMWGLSFIASKFAMQSGFGEFTLAFVRYVFVCAILLPLLRLKEGTLRLPDKKDWPGIALTGLTGISLYFIFEYMGVMRTTVANASLVLAAIPVFSILWGAIMGRRYRAACWLGVAVSMAGVFLVVWFSAAGESGLSTGTVLLGNLLLLGACVCWVIYLEVSRNLLARYGSFPLTVWQGVAGLIGLLPAMLYEGFSGQWVPVPLGGWAAALFLAVICSALCFFWYAQAIRALSTLQVAIFINLNPIVAVLGGVLLLGEGLNWMQGLGGLLIVGSILLVNVGTGRR